MKKLLLFVFLCALGLGTNAQVWVSQATGFATPSRGVRNIAAVDANVVWIASYDGSGAAAQSSDFSRTIDGGATWTAGTIPVPTGYDFSMITASDANNAWAAFFNSGGGGGGIWHTSDGGVTWAQQGAGVIYNDPNNSFPNIVHFWSATEGMTMGDPSGGNFEIYTTTDGGTTWTSTTAPAALAGEFGVVDHLSVFGNSIWFSTDFGRVFRSTDKGLTWAVSTTGSAVGDQFDICFYSLTNGIARIYAAGTNSFFQTTSDGGATWANGTVNGDLFGGDVAHVPGTASRLMSTGVAQGFEGSSYSNDGGLNWTTIETGIQRSALGIVDSTTMWAGGFNADATSGGIFKFSNVQCGDASVSAGTASAANTLICAGDTAVFTIAGAVAPTPGDFSGFSWLITTADITGNTDPLNDPSLIAGYGISPGGPAASTLEFINDGAFIDGTILPYGAYYWTPIVFANATSAVAPGSILDLVLDPACTYTGTSVMVNVVGETRPAISVTANSPLTCDSIDKTIVLTSNLVAGASYSWTGPNGFTSTLQSPTIPNATPADSGLYFLVITEPISGCNSAMEVLVVVDTLPRAYISTNGATTFCDGDSVTLTATPGTAYVWLPNNETTQSITVLASGTFSSVVTDPNGCVGDATAAVVNVTVNPNPAVPVITMVNDSIINPVVGTAYHWYKNGVLQPSKTTKSIRVVASQNGSWYVIVENSFGCTSQSNAIQTSVGIAELINANGFAIYPNPSKGMFTIEINAVNSDKASIKIVDITGRMVFEQTSLKNKFAVDLTQNAKGIYYLQLNDGNKIVTGKLVVE